MDTISEILSKPILFWSIKDKIILLCIFFTISGFFSFCFYVVQEMIYARKTRAAVKEFVERKNKEARDGRSA